MTFSTRNAYYLRVSNYRVIPLFLYLDERHVDWMSDRVLQLVIASLQHKLPNMLWNARGEKKHKVHVERGEDYQFCYFLRSTTRTEVVLLKSKTVSLRPPTPPPAVLSEPQGSKRKRSTQSTRSSSKAPRQSRAGTRASSRARSVSVRYQDGEEEEGEEDGVGDGDDGDNYEKEGIETFEGENAMRGYDPDGIQVKAEPDPDEEEDEFVGQPNIKDWKPDVDVTFKGTSPFSLLPPSSPLSPVLHVHVPHRANLMGLCFLGFGTSSIQLVLIIEPYPPLPPSQYAPPSSRLSSRSASVMSAHSRARSSQTRMRGERESGRYSSASLSLSVAPDGSRGEGGERGGGVRGDSIANMRNASRAPSVANSRKGGSSTPFREESSTPGFSGSGSMGSRRRMSQTPLFMPRDTPFDEDEEEHEIYLSALAEGRQRLPSVFHPAGEGGGRGRGRGRGREEEEEEEEEDIPESVIDIGERLVRNSEIEQGVVRVQGGWEERGDGEESAVMGREEPGD
ncbi:hypothetical protein C359_05038 [Cryptococcus neoformans Bt120]|nr:hypothetical protein C359_05038 [Cryptococcus neoformans var. grubii Bt120]